MSQIKNPVGRPAASGRDKFGPLNSLADCSGAFANLLGVEPEHHELVWHLPFREVFEGIQSVGGLAKLAGVSRKTIYRKKLNPGGVMALGWVIEWRRGTPRPLVTHTDPAHPLNMGNRLPVNGGGLFPGTVLDVVAACKAYLENGLRNTQSRLMKPPELGQPSNPLHKLVNVNRMWKRKQKISPDVNAKYLTDDELREFAESKRLGQTYLYKPPWRVTVKMICSRFRIPRWKFYRWKAGLLAHERALLGAAMSGKFSSVQNSPGDDSWLRKKTAEFDFGEIDERLNWNEPA